MNIGIDIDGVIFDTEEYFRCYAELFDIERGGNGAVNPWAVRSQDRYGWDKDVAHEFLKKYALDIQRTAPIKAGAREVLTALKNIGHNLYIVSARGVVFDEELETTNRRLNEEKLPIDGVFIQVQDKLAVCRENNIEVMIDDSDNNVRKLSDGGIKCLYLRDVVGESVDNPNVKEVKNWGEILRYFKNI